MMLTILIATTWLLTTISFGVLQKHHPKEFEFVGGEKIYFWWPTQIEMFGYFYIFGYRSIINQLGKSLFLFLTTSIVSWVMLVWFFKELVSLL